MEPINTWPETLTAAMTNVWSELTSFLPNIVGALLILIVGYLVAKAASLVLKRLIVALGVDRFGATSGINGVLTQVNIELSMSGILARIVFWIMILTFLVSATETLGLPRVSSTIDSLVTYLPKVLGAALILLVGLFVAGRVRDIVRTAATGFGFEHAKTLGSCFYGLLIVIVALLAIGQLELETAALAQAISIVLLSAGAAVALAFGLGAKDVASNVLAGSYVRETFRGGDQGLLR